MEDEEDLGNNSGDSNSLSILPVIPSVQVLHVLSHNISLKFMDIKRLAFEKKISKTMYSKNLLINKIKSP